jgi:hypothetical protein
MQCRDSLIFFPGLTSNEVTEKPEALKKVIFFFFSANKIKCYQQYNSKKDSVSLYNPVEECCAFLLNSTYISTVFTVQYVDMCILHI